MKHTFLILSLQRLRDGDLIIHLVMPNYNDKTYTRWLCGQVSALIRRSRRPELILCPGRRSRMSCRPRESSLRSDNRTGLEASPIGPKGCRNTVSDNPRGWIRWCTGDCGLLAARVFRKFSRRTSFAALALGPRTPSQSTCAS